MRKILIVDDDIINNFTVKHYLQNYGFKVLVSKNGVEGLNILADNQDVSLIIVDCHMPEMDGIEFCLRIKKNDSLKNIPVLMLTGLDGLTDKYVGFSVGVSDYLTKPFELLELYLRIKNILGKNV